MFEDYFFEAMENGELNEVLSYLEETQRLLRESSQKSPSRSKSIAMTKLDEALLWLGHDIGTRILEKTTTEQ